MFDWSLRGFYQSVRTNWFAGVLPLGLLLATLVFPGAIAAQQANNLCIIRGRVWNRPDADAVWIRDGRIAGVGRLRDLVVPETTKRVDANGGLILPGFHDAHIHMLAGGMSLTQLDLSDKRTLADVLDAVRSYAQSHRDQAWIIGRGWQYDALPQGAFPTRHDLDRVVADRPVLIGSYDGHSSWVNSRALQLASVSADTDDPEDGTIVREANSRVPSGVLLEAADELVRRLVPKPSRAEVQAALQRAAQHCVRLGITTVQDLVSDIEIVDIYEELLTAGQLPVRVILAPPVTGDLEAYQQVRDRLHANRQRSERLRFGFLKGFVDGVVESRTAYMLTPYVNSTERGKPLLGAQRLQELVEQSHQRGMLVGVHAVGDGAVRLALDAFASGPTPTRSALRGRIEHVEVLAPADARRFATGRVIASVMPLHANPNGSNPQEQTWAMQLGAERVRHGFAFRELVDAGATLAFGSDWPVMSADPLWGVAVAVSRRDILGRPENGWHAEQALTADESIRAYTVGSAASAGLEEHVGQLAVGQWGDVVVLRPHVDPDRPASLWHGVRIHVVVVGGALVWASW